MSQIQSFEIENFKGVKYAKIEIPKAAGAVTTLIGLNESGKTTILEAISHFGVENEVVSSVFNRVYKKENAVTFIPIAEKAAFDGNVKISANVLFDKNDSDLMAMTALEQGF